MVGPHTADGGDADAGQTGGGQPDGGPLDGEPPSTPCSHCAQSYCPDQLAACEAQPDWSAYMQCINACSDSACTDQCAQNHSIGAAANEPLRQCLLARCASACSGGGTGDAGGSGGADGASDLD